MNKIKEKSPEQLNLPIRESMRTTHIIKGDIDYYVSKYHRDWTSMFRFISSRVGKSYNDTYSEFVKVLKESKKYSKVLDREYAKDRFKSFFNKGISETEWGISPFDVIDGKIRENERYFHKKRHIKRSNEQADI